MSPPPLPPVDSARLKIARLLSAAFNLSRDDRKIMLYGQLLTALATTHDAANLASIVDIGLTLGERPVNILPHRPQQQFPFEQA